MYVPGVGVVNGGTRTYCELMAEMVTPDSPDTALCEAACVVAPLMSDMLMFASEPPEVIDSDVADTTVDASNE